MAIGKCVDTRPHIPDMEPHLVIQLDVAVLRRIHAKQRRTEQPEVRKLFFRKVGHIDDES